MKVGIVGAGNMGALHANLLQNRSGVEFLGFADVDIDRAILRTNQFGGKVYQSVSEMLDSVPDVVFVTIPNTKHVDIVVECLRNKVKVFCEKPLVTSLKDAEKIMDVVGENQDLLYVGFNRRFAPVYAKAKKIIESGFQVFSGNIIMNDGDMTNPPWVTNVELTGGFLYDTTIHMFDMIRYLVGEIVEVRSIGNKCVYPIQDNFSMEFTTSSGQTVVLSSNGHASWLWPTERIQLWGNHATIVTDELDAVTYCVSDQKAVETINVKNFDKNLKWGYVQMHEDFFSSIFEGKEPNVKAVDGYKSILIADACYRSVANRGQVISL